MAKFVDHPNKHIIRDHWCNPLLNHLHNNLGLKLMYLGLPGIECLDILSWIHYLEYVIAVDCGDYSDDFDIDKAKANIQKLNKILLTLEAEERISGFSLYLGYIEEIVLQGRDLLGNKFTQTDLVQIYNLDFCNTLTSPLELPDLNGKVHRYYKIQVIRKLLEIQRDLCSRGRGERFLMFVTVHSRFWESEAERYFHDVQNPYYRAYTRSISGLSADERSILLLRYYFFETIKTHFTTSGFIPEFFPVIYYKGATNSNLLCFTVAGTYYQTPAATASFNQKLGNLIKSKFLTIQNDDIIMSEDFGNVLNVNPNPIENLTRFHSYQNLWIPKKR